MLMSDYYWYHLFVSQPAETQDAESAFGSDSSSVLEWRPSESISLANQPAPTPKKAISALRVQVRGRRKRRASGGGVVEGDLVLMS